ncbi:MAG: alpha-ketoglutarate-dependent dioxygenase AlkB family protein [Marinibacterium sp.]
MRQGPVDLRGVALWKGFLDVPAQTAVLDDLRPVLTQAPFFVPVTSRGREMSVRTSSAGSVGWISDRSGYRYAPEHPRGTAWPDIPDRILAIWDGVTGINRRPDTCLINFYGEGARIGMHQDRDEADLTWPVVSVSLGDDALFRVGGTTRGGKTNSVWLTSGDVVVMGGRARLVYHGVDRIRFGTSRLLPKGGRVNLTLRIAG